MRFDLNCVGLSQYETYDDKYELVNDIVNNPSRSKEIKHSDDNVYVEKTKTYKQNLGVIVRGEMGKDNRLVVKDFVPYVESNNVIKVDEIEVEELVKQDKEKDYQVNFVEPRTNLELSFALQNIVEYMGKYNKNSFAFKGVNIVALADSAKIILPTANDGKNQVETADYIVGSNFFGEEEVEHEESVEMQREIIIESIKESDIYTVMETYIIQSNIETVYKILGNITDVKLVKNQESNESLYILSLKVMGIDMEVCINKKNLIGVPSVGMRFTGTCWLQGKIIF